MSKFYATYKEAHEALIMFKTRKERDDWVDFKDEVSLALGRTAEDATFQRVAVSNKVAEQIVGSRRIHIENYIQDEFLDNAMWIETDIPAGRQCDLILDQPYLTAGQKATKAETHSVKTTTKTNKKECNTMKNNKINFKPTMKLNERKMIASATEKNAIKIGSKKLAWVPVELMNIKPYQRDRQKHLNSIAEHWDDNKCNVLTVSYDAENGWFNIVDGQHRAAAARMRGIEYLVCEILNDMNDSAEARLFVDANINSKKLSPYDTYKANQFISAEDDTKLSKIDKRLAKVCAEHGVVVKKSEACGVLKSVPQARDILANENEAEDCLNFIFEVIQGSQWDKFKNGYCYVVMNALRKVYDSHKDNLEFVKTQMCNYLIKTSPREVESLGNNKYANLGRTARWDAVLSQIIG